ncbi:MAG: glycosyltransferase family 25 protein [Chlamydiales bacterium]|nr:glycosyltransferase family 25 protein [Chlamydiia bacterium]MCP5508266.1 glycosyltransferase family 25 protein [Chlamydiales bacterium]
MKMRLFLLLMISLCAVLHADLRDHLRPCENKGSNHQMKNIDFIYVINLDERPEKLEKTMQELEPYNIHPYRFSAVNGWKLTLEEINELGVKYEPGMRSNLWGTCYLPEDGGEPHHEIMQVPGRNYFCHCMARGAIGICLSHLSILQDAYDSGYETIWVMEDDIQVIRSPLVIPELIAELDRLVGKKGWDILFTDPDTKNQKGAYVECHGHAHRPNFTPKHPGRFAKRSQCGPYFRKVGARYGAYSMIVRRSAMKKILDFINQYQIFLPLDMDFYLPDDIRLYTTSCDIVSTRPVAESDNGKPGYILDKKDALLVDDKG